jgi:hypothetical protein
VTANRSPVPALAEAVVEVERGREEDVVFTEATFH